MQDHCHEFAVEGAWHASRACPPQVVLSEGAPPPLQHAAGLLRAYLGRILGAQADRSGTAARIALEVDRHAHSDAYRYAITGQSLAIVGGSPLATSLGAFAFLREACGCIFAGPHPDAEHVPELAAITFSPGAAWRYPRHPYRAMMFTTQEPLSAERDRLDWMLKNGLNFVMYRLAPPGGASDEIDPHTGQRHGGMSSEGPRMTQAWFDQHLLPEITRRGLRLDFSHHNLSFWVSPATCFERHPEWFALSQGQRRASGCQLSICTSCPEAVGALIQAIRQYLWDHPAVERVGVIPEDGVGMCACDACVAADGEPDASQRPWYGHMDPASINFPKSRRYARLLNEVAAAIAPEFPQVRIVGGAYVDLQWPAPDVELHPAIVMWLAIYWRDGARPLAPTNTSPINRFFFDLIAQWHAKLGDRLYLYEYYMGMNAQHALPYPMASVLCEDWMQFRGLAGRRDDGAPLGGAAVQCLTSLHQAYGLNLFEFAACTGYGEGSPHPHDLLETYLKGMYGSAARAVQPVY